MVRMKQLDHCGKGDAEPLAICVECGTRLEDSAPPASQHDAAALPALSV